MTQRVTEQARDRAIRRFASTPERAYISDTDDRSLVNLRDQVIEFGALIDVSCPDGLDKTIALTHLEDAYFRAARAIYMEAHR